MGRNLLEELRPGIDKLSARLARVSGEAREDLVQAAIAAVLAADVRCSARPARWFGAVARNAMVDAVRRAMKHPRYPLPRDLVARNNNGRIHPDDVEILRRALSDGARILLEERMQEIRLTNQDAAARFCVSPATVSRWANEIGDRARRLGF